MGEFIGAIGGLLMVVVIVVLLFRFLRECGIGIFEKGDVKALLCIILMALLEIMICGEFSANRGVDTTILNIHVVFADKGFLFEEQFPFNWYVSYALGVYTVFGVYRLTNREFSSIWIALAVPFVWLCFLPCYVSCISAGCMLVLQIVNRIMRQRIRDVVGGVIARFVSAKSGIIYDITLSCMAVLAGCGVIGYLGE